MQNNTYAEDGFTTIVQVHEFDRRRQLEQTESYRRDIEADLAAAFAPYSKAA